MKKLLFVAFILLLISPGCIGNKFTVKPVKGTVTLAISADLTFKTIQPDLDMNIAAYDVYGAGPEGTNFRKNGSTSNPISIESIAAGIWTITVDAKNDEGIIIASGITNVTVVAGTTTDAGVTVTPLTGTGALKVNLSWPGGTIANPVINATLTPKERLHPISPLH